MARRPDSGGRPSLSPRARWLAGWVAAIVVIGGIALVVRVLGGNADGVAVVPTSSPGTDAGPAAAIRFGTALDPATGEVAADAETDRFVASDRFVYSHRPADPPPSTVWVEVLRGANGAGEAVQPPAPHALAEDALVIAFDVPASALIADFGTGAFQMRISLGDGDPPAAVGSFELVAPASSGSP